MGSDTFHKQRSEGSWEGIVNKTSLCYLTLLQYQGIFIAQFGYKNEIYLLYTEYILSMLYIYEYIAFKIIYREAISLLLVSNCIESLIHSFLYIDIWTANNEKQKDLKKAFFQWKHCSYCSYQHPIAKKIFQEFISVLN